MKIERAGAYAYHGTSNIEIEEPDYSWDNENECIIIKKKKIKDFSGDSHHDYKISISLQEIAALIQIVGEEPTNDSPEAIASALSPNLRQLHRIINSCIGNVGNQNTKNA